MVFPSQSLVLVGRGAGPPPAAAAVLALALTAEERTRLRGLRQSRCGRPLLLQLPRGAPLQPGEWLQAEPSDAGPLPWVRVEAAPEALLLVRAPHPLALLQAAYHLGNRHVALELRERELRLGEDGVLADLLRRRGLVVERRLEPFLPEAGAYAGPSHTHAHAHDHDQNRDHRHEPGPSHVQPRPVSPHQGSAHDHDPGSLVGPDPGLGSAAGPVRLPSPGQEEADHSPSQRNLGDSDNPCGDPTDPRDGSALARADVSARRDAAPPGGAQ